MRTKENKLSEREINNKLNDLFIYEYSPNPMQEHKPTFIDSSSNINLNRLTQEDKERFKSHQVNQRAKSLNPALKNVIDIPNAMDLIFFKNELNHIQASFPIWLDSIWYSFNEKMLMELREFNKTHKGTGWYIEVYCTDDDKICTDPTGVNVIETYRVFNDGKTDKIQYADMSSDLSK